MSKLVEVIEVYRECEPEESEAIFWNHGDKESKIKPIKQVCQINNGEVAWVKDGFFVRKIYKSI